METKLDWGSYKELKQFKSWPARYLGRALFITRNGKTFFPDSDVRLWPWDNNSDVGYLNIAETTFRVDVRDLTSKDGAHCCSVIHYEVKLKPDKESRIAAVTRHDDLYNTFSLLTKECADTIFKQFDYTCLFLKEERVGVEFEKTVKRAIEESTPYQLIRFVFASVASMAAGVDEEILRAHSAKITAPRIIEAGEVDDKIANTIQIAERKRELEEAEHIKSINYLKNAAIREEQRLADEYEAKKITANNEEEIRIRRLEREQEHHFLEKKQDKLLEISKNLGQSGSTIFAYITANDPRLAADIIKGNQNVSTRLETQLARITASKAFDAGQIDAFRAITRSTSNINVNPDVRELGFDQRDGEDGKDGINESQDSAPTSGEEPI